MITVITQCAVNAVVGVMAVRPDDAQRTPNIVGVASSRACGVQVNIQREAANDG